MVKKTILAIFLICVTLLGSLSFFAVSPAQVMLGYPVYLIDIFSHAPDGSDMSARNVGDRLKNDVLTLTGAYLATIVGKLTNPENGGQLKRSECFSTLEQMIYFVQSSIRFFQGTYGDNPYDDPFTNSQPKTIQLSTAFLSSFPVLEIRIQNVYFYNRSFTTGESGAVRGDTAVYRTAGNQVFVAYTQDINWTIGMPDIHHPILSGDSTAPIIVTISRVDGSTADLSLPYFINDVRYTHNFRNGSLTLTISDDGITDLQLGSN